MKKSDSPEMRSAMESEHLVAANRGVYATCALYGIEGTPGLYRRIARTATGLNVGHPHSVLARWQGGVIELTRVPEIDAELAECGLKIAVAPASPKWQPDLEEESEPPPPYTLQPSLLDRIDAGEVLSPAEIKESAGALMDLSAPEAAEEMTAAELLALNRGQAVETPDDNPSPESEPETSPVEQPKSRRKSK